MKNKAKLFGGLSYALFLKMLGNGGCNVTYSYEYIRGKVCYEDMHECLVVIYEELVSHSIAHEFRIFYPVPSVNAHKGS